MYTKYMTTKETTMKVTMHRRWIYGTGGYGWKSIDTCKKEQYQFGDFNPTVSVRAHFKQG